MNTATAQSAQSISDAPLISVALCTHNGMPFVAEQVRSILHQTMLPAELVVSDDASTDETVPTIRGIVDRFRAERPGAALRFVVLQNSQPLGVTANFEQAVLACTGDLIALCDQDDVWVPERLEFFAREFLARPEVTLLHSDARLVDAGGAPLAHTLAESIEFTSGERRDVHRGNAFDVLLRRNVVTGATAVFRRELLPVATPFPASWVHDEWLAMMASITGQVDYLPQPLVDYRQHASNQIGAQKLTMAGRFARLREPRAGRNQRLAERAQALVNHLETLEDLPVRPMKLARQKLKHERARSALPASRVLRVLPVMRLSLAGSYHRFGRARYDIVRDLLQPPA